MAAALLGEGPAVAEPPSQSRDDGEGLDISADSENPEVLPGDDAESEPDDSETEFFSEFLAFRESNLRQRERKVGRSFRPPTPCWRSDRVRGPSRGPSRRGEPQGPEESK